MFDAGFLEALAIGLIIGFFTPVFCSDWGKWAIFSLGLVICLTVIWQITGWNTFTFTALTFAGGNYLGAKCRKFYALRQLRKIVADNLRQFQSRVSN